MMSFVINQLKWKGHKENHSFFSLSESDLIPRVKFWSKVLQNYKEKYIHKNYIKILDIGAGSGLFIQAIRQLMGNNVLGIEPKKHLVNEKDGICYGWAHDIPYGDNSFDLISLISVFEHIPPNLHTPSLREISRVLSPEGLLFWQLPNPRFPIEIHTHLPLLGYVPLRIEELWSNLGFWPISVKMFAKKASKMGFESIETQNYIYPINLIPKKARKLYFITKVFHMGSFGILKLES